MQKIITIILTVGISIAVIAGLGYAFQDYLRSVPGPEKVTKDFYQSWVNQKESPLASKFYQNHVNLTKRLEDNIQETIDSFDKGGADPILCAQDKPQNMSFELISKTDERAIVKIYEDFGGNSQIIKAGLVKNVDGWLIDEIICSNKTSEEVSTDESNLVGDYIKENISILSPKDPVLGGSFYVTEINFVSPGIAIINYEDGHIALEAQVEYEVESGDVIINKFNIQE